MNSSKRNIKQAFYCITIFSFLVVLDVRLVHAQSKITPRIDLAYFQEDSALIYLKVKVRKKIEKRFEPVGSIKVHFYLENESEQISIGNVVTNINGEGQTSLPEAIRSSLTVLNEYNFTAAVDQSDETEEASETLTITPGRLKIVTNDEDEKMITILVESREGKDWIPLEGVEVKVFVKRTFGQLAVGEEAYVSDVNGSIELPFAEEIPGDEKGIIILGCAIEDHDELGNLFAFTSVQWGVPLKGTDAFNKRTLWGTRDKTPLWLLIFPNLIIAGVWGVIVYLCFQIFRIKRLAKSIDK